MAIVSIGNDLCQISRIADVLERRGEGFCARIYSDAERAYCEARPRSRAAGGVLLLLLGPRAVSGPRATLLWPPSCAPARGGLQRRELCAGSLRLRLSCGSGFFCCASTIHSANSFGGSLWLLPGPAIGTLPGG